MAGAGSEEVKSRVGLSTVIWWIRRAPITNRPLYWRKEFPRPFQSPEVSAEAQRHFSRGIVGHRFYGLATYPNKIALDVENIGLGAKAPLLFLREVLIHEACHLAIGGHHIKALLKRALASPEVLYAAHRRILRMIPRGRV